MITITSRDHKLGLISSLKGVLMDGREAIDSALAIGKDPSNRYTEEEKYLLKDQLKTAETQIKLLRGITKLIEPKQ